MISRGKLKDYVEVKERIRAFYEKYPAGSIQTELVRLDVDLVVFRAKVYRDPADPHPTTGWAYEREGSPPVASEAGRDPGRTHFVENCETSAIGRALANLNLAGPRRPSREEMEKAIRMAEAQETPAQRIRRLARELRLSPAKRRRIEQKLETGLSEREAHDLEAYLLALRPRATAGRS